MKKLFLACLFMLVFAIPQLVLGQVNTDLRPAVKSPEVNKFEQYMNMPVNLVSGTPQVSIPIYTLNYGGMSLPISLEYDASGVKVESIASCVGQNWTLNVGGVVSRIVKGAPDEGAISYSSTSQININGYYKDNGLSNLDTELNKLGETQNFKYAQFNTWIQECNSGKKDAQPDLFYFSTPEGGSKYVFNDKKEVVYLENTDFVIKQDFVGSFFRTWLATSPSGIQYKFGKDTGTAFGENNVVEKNYTNRGGSETTNYIDFIVNSWFLSEMSNFNNNNKIQLEYIDNNYSNTILNKPVRLTSECLPSWTQSSSITNCGDEKTNYDFWAKSPYDPESDGGANTPKTMQTHNLSKLISKITAGRINILFEYSNREDLLPDLAGGIAKRLDKIQVLENGICIKKFTFYYAYTNSQDMGSGFINLTDADKKRLVLNKLEESSCDATIVKPYIFVYNTTPLPNKLSFAQDKWGFYNGKVDNVSILPRYSYTDNLGKYFGDRSVDLSFAKAGSLESIIYPTKGTVNFEYESHKSDTPVDYFIEPVALNYKANDFQPQPQGLNTSPSNSTTFLYDLNFDQVLVLNATLMFPSYNQSSIPSWCNESNMNAVEILNSNNVVIESISYSELRDLQMLYPREKVSKIVRKVLNASLFVKYQTYTLKVYGLTDCYHNMTSLAVHNTKPIYDIGGLRIKKITHRNFDNTILKQMNYNYLKSKIVSNPKLANKFNWSFSNLEPYYWNVMQIAPQNATYLKNTLSNNLDPYGHGNAYKYGFYYYLSSGNDPLDISFAGPHITYQEVIETDLNGSTKSYFNPYQNYIELSKGEPLKLYPPIPKIQSILAGEKQKVELFDKNNNTLKIQNFNHNYKSDKTSVKGVSVTVKTEGLSFFNVYTLEGQTKTLLSETETSKLNGQELSTTKTYEYNGKGHYMPTKTTVSTSNGTSIVTKTAYPQDLLTEPLMANLIAQNRKVPIKQESFRTVANDTVTVKIAEQKTVFAQDATSNLLLPKSVYAGKFSKLLNGTIIGNLERKVTSDSYDSSGNLTQFTPESGVPVSIIWGYNNTQPVAKLENMAYASIPTSLITAIQSATNSSSSTEAQVLTALNALRSSTDANMQKAQITTYTYKPLIGVTSITDPKGDKQTYTYDGLGRLLYVKDKDGKILSQNQYHYKN